MAAYLVVVKTARGEEALSTFKSALSLFALVEKGSHDGGRTLMVRSVRNNTYLLLTFPKRHHV